MRVSDAVEAGQSILFRWEVVAVAVGSDVEKLGGWVFGERGEKVELG